MKDLYKRFEDIKYLKDEGYIKDYQKMMDSLDLLQVKNKKMYEHSERVAKYSEIIAYEFFDDKKKIDCVWVSALFHDIGKILVPNYILKNTDSLTPEEFEIIKKHSYDGYKISKRFFNEDLCAPVLEHHERLSGNGYPFEKKSLSLETKIVAVVDTFDAMTSERDYQKALSFEEAISKLEDLANNKDFYDKDVVDKLKKVISEGKIKATKR